MKWGESECGQERLSKISCCCPLTNGAPTLNAPLVIQVTNGAPSGGAPLVVLQKKNILMAHCSTVLVMAHGEIVCHQQFCKKGIKNIIKKQHQWRTFRQVRHYQLQLVMEHCVWMRHQYVWTGALVKFFFWILMAHPGPGAPLVVSALMAYQKVVCHQYILMAHRLSGAPLVSIPSIALFLVVLSRASR